MKILYKTLFIATGLITAQLVIAQSSQRPLRVCTTGDYPPLTFYNAKTHTYEGFAINVMTAFAQSLKRPITFIHTTWPHLNQDLKHRCDIAMGGITKTPARAKDFILSNNILPNTKAAIFSKKNEQNFKSLKDIDQKNVTILENEGGTNEVFANTHIKNARIKILPQNLQVFACLNKYPEKPYAMFTDSIEIQYRTMQPDTLLSNKGIHLSGITDTPTYKIAMANKTKKGKQLIKAFNQFHQSHQQQFKDWFTQALKTNYPQPDVTCPF
ncbi:transporter substrate-binding domain-containing protein [Facilibium subflavum]|uniref:transporter substrate-binding domain-containing protein n=1 Tax=Facilibium subflavum TaxID=2219058 RepID=UPI000E65A02E|nr:transporter substrate-binding domain-containing protein [Facilibium subflavum]